MGDEGQRGEVSRLGLDYSQQPGVRGYKFRSLPRTGVIPLVDDDTIQARYYTFIMVLHLQYWIHSIPDIKLTDYTRGSVAWILS